jgi:hypothetical protein
MQQTYAKILVPFQPGGFQPTISPKCNYISLTHVSKQLVGAAPLTALRLCIADRLELLSNTPHNKGSTGVSQAFRDAAWPEILTVSHRVH